MTWVPVTRDRVPSIAARARALRREMTPAELELWEQLRHRFRQYRFRRQHPMGHFIADFYCHHLRLVLEVDGAVHDTQREYDADRQAWFESQGYQVIRFTNEQVLNHLEEVLQSIAALTEDQCDRPSD